MRDELATVLAGTEGLMDSTKGAPDRRDRSEARSRVVGRRALDVGQRDERPDAEQERVAVGRRR